MTLLSSEIFSAHSWRERAFIVPSVAPWGHVWYTSPKSTFVGLSGLQDNKLSALISLPLRCPV